MNRKTIRNLVCSGAAAGAWLTHFERVMDNLPLNGKSYCQEVDVVPEHRDGRVAGVEVQFADRLWAMPVSALWRMQ